MERVRFGENSECPIVEIMISRWYQVWCNFKCGYIFILMGAEVSYFNWYMVLLEIEFSALFLKKTSSH